MCLLRWCCFLLLLSTAFGCSSDREKGVNKDKDRPKAEPAQQTP